MKLLTSRFFINSAVILLLSVNIPAQQYSEEDTSDKLKALQKELEEAKQYRDRVIAKRWEDRTVYNESREKFNDNYDDLKEKLELKNNDVEREREQIGSLLNEVEELKARKEAAKIQFLGLSSQQKSAIKEISESFNKNIPLLIPERQGKLNEVNKAIEIKKDSPIDIFNNVLTLYLNEIKITREISIDKREFLRSDNTSGHGTFLRLGMMAAAYKDNATGSTGLLLRTANTSGLLYEWREDLNEKAKKSLELTLSQLENNSKAGTVTIPLDILRSRAVGKGYTEGEKKGFVASSMAYLKDGGIWMWPLMAIAVAALILLVERFIGWVRKNSGNQKLFNEVLELVKKGEIEKAEKITSSLKNSSVLKAMNSVLNSRSKSREVAEKELQEIILQETPSLEKRLTTISVLGAAAPLLGLLGTVAGMIELFESITLYGTSDPKLMAGGISIALITTQTGLAISVPIMIAHNFIANRVDSLVGKMENYALKSLNLLWPDG